MLRIAFQSIVLRFSVPLFGVINFMMLVRILSESEIGIWVLYISFVSIVEVTKSGFIKNASVRYLNLPQKEHDVIIASLFLNFAFTAVLIPLILIGSTVFYHQGDQVVAMLLLVFCGQLLVHIPFAHFDYQLSARLKFGTMMYAYIVRNLFLLLCLAYFFFVAPRQTLTLVHMAVFQAVGLALATAYIAIRIKPKRIPWVLNKPLTREIANFGKYIFATNISSVLFRSTDQYMLGIMLSSTSVAYYNVAVRITNLIDLPSTAASEVLLPRSVKSMQSSGTRDLKRLYEKTVGYVLAIAIPATLGVYVLADWVILIIAGKDYAESVPILRVTLLYGLMLPYLKQFGTIMDTLGKPKVNFLTILSIFLVNLISNYVAIHYFGLIGAAYGTLIAYVFGLIINQNILVKEVSVSFVNTLRFMMEAYRELYTKAISYASSRI